MNIYMNTNYQNDKLWITSLLRIFYLESIINSLNINSFVHFDLDVLIYKSFNELKKCFDIKKINITRLTDNEIIFSYSYIPNMNIYNEFCDLLFEKIKYNYEKSKNDYQ